MGAQSSKPQGHAVHNVPAVPRWGFREALGMQTFTHAAANTYSEEDDQVSDVRICAPLVVPCEESLPFLEFWKGEGST